MLKNHQAGSETKQEQSPTEEINNRNTKLIPFCFVFLVRPYAFNEPSINISKTGFPISMFLRLDRKTLRRS